jgi:hypothetical protein
MSLKVRESSTKQKVETWAYGGMVTFWAAAWSGIMFFPSEVSWLSGIFTVFAVFLVVVWVRRDDWIEVLPDPSRSAFTTVSATRLTFTESADQDWWNRWGPESPALIAELGPEEWAALHNVELPVDKDTQIARLKEENRELTELAPGELLGQDDANRAIQDSLVKIRACELALAQAREAEAIYTEALKQHVRSQISG